MWNNFNHRHSSLTLFWVRVSRCSFSSTTDAPVRSHATYRLKCSPLSHSELDESRRRARKKYESEISHSLRVELSRRKEKKENVKCTTSFGINIRGPRGVRQDLSFAERVDPPITRAQCVYLRGSVEKRRRIMPREIAR